jgi:hypothetical protein
MSEIRCEFSRVRLGLALVVLASIGKTLVAFRINSTPVYRTVFPIKTLIPLSKVDKLLQPYGDGGCFN